MKIAIRQAPAWAKWLVFALPYGDFDYMPDTTELCGDEKLIATGLTLAKAIAKVDELREIVWLAEMAKRATQPDPKEPSRYIELGG